MLMEFLCYTNQNQKGWSVVYKNRSVFLTFPEILIKYAMNGASGCCRLGIICKHIDLI